ncbi:hypothetical protein DFH94DRAFT_631706 [Russula ochroleuca]|uniref:F-box only protein 9 n=1 Tax=Russula ochroleuca TaxID=152965 RepID=A0A9P5MVQ9_9AGAM|nr:hypothetical protein DFH94DRAFT_631706 [Russula ochroleuca]
MVAVEEEETDELRRFRESWKRELQEKKKLQQSLQDSAPPAAALPEQLSSTSETNPLHHSGVFRPRNDALEVYSRAVKHEQAGELDDALRLYRQAFRTDSNVDRLYHLREQRTTRTLEALALTATTAEENVENKAAVLVNAQSNSVVPKPPSSAPHPEQQVSGLLADILAGFPIPLSFEPEDERVSLVLQRLPDELLVYILSYLGAAAIERFALVSRKARVITLDATIWRSFVETIYRPPQISPNETLDDILDKHSSDYRRVYVERPRVRLDGVYIAVCHYIRHGLSENAWVNISHLITYHRYLRFYPNGQVISLLANEEHEPQHVITMLRPTLRMKGFYIGTWKLSGLTVQVSNLVDPSNPTARYSFRMTLTLRSRPLGRWNKLEFLEYESINLEDGEATALGLKNERPFWFSKVRSYSSRIE